MIKFLFIMGMVLLVGLIILGGMELVALYEKVNELENEIEELKNGKNKKG
jgi:hypothetical protein